MKDLPLVEGITESSAKKKDMNHTSGSLSGIQTVQRLGDTVLLIPENDNYEPIQMRRDQISVIGVAVGILKRM